MCDDHRFSHGHRFENRGHACLKISVVQWHNNHSCPSVLIAQRTAVELVGRDVRPTWRTVGSIPTLGPVARRANNHLYIEFLDGFDECRVVAELQTCTADRSLLGNVLWTPELRVHLVRHERE